jgi:hypothetical protein
LAAALSGCSGQAASSALRLMPGAPAAIVAKADPAVVAHAAAARFAPNYKDDLKNARRWDKETVSIYVTLPAADSGAPVRDYLSLVKRGVALWEPYDRDLIDVVFVDDPRQADIRVSFVPAGSLPEGAVGRTEVTYRDRDNVLVAATVRIDWTMTDETLSQVSAHEMGHAFGLEGHSNSRDDLMYARVHLPAVITSRDANTLAWNYAFGARRASAAPAAQPPLVAANFMQPDGRPAPGFSTFAAACHLDEAQK